MKSKKNIYKKLLISSVISRIFYISMAYLSDIFLKHYDKSTLIKHGNSSFRCLLRWDAIHFYNIAKDGYINEHSSAFFPLLPAIVNRAQKLVGSDIFTVGIIVNNIFFIIESIVLYRITEEFFGSFMALKTFYFFIFNPASIIYSSLYTESLFSLLFSISIYFLLKKKTVYMIIALSLTCICRSNGIINLTVLFSRYTFGLFETCKLFCNISLIILPMAIFQLYILSKYLKMTCGFTFFIPYSRVQIVYWNQGLFKFFTKNNIPNVIIGAPFIYAALYMVIFNLKRIKISDKHKNIVFYSLNIILLLQTFISILFLQWNMFFRFISYNPVIYWSLSHIDAAFKNKGWVSRFLLRVYLGYGIAYAILFGCFYPPA